MQCVISSDVVSHPGAASCISGSRGYSSEEARCYGVGRFFFREVSTITNLVGEKRGEERG